MGLGDEVVKVSIWRTPKNVEGGPDRDKGKLGGIFNLLAAPRWQDSLSNPTILVFACDQVDNRSEKTPAAGLLLQLQSLKQVSTIWVNGQINGKP